MGIQVSLQSWQAATLSKSAMMDAGCRIHEISVKPAARVSARPQFIKLSHMVAISCVCGTAIAAETQSEMLETVVVTSPPLALGAEAFSTMHLAADELATASQLDVALNQVPGLSLFRRDSSLSANPTTQGISLRSIAPSGAGRALVTLDGVPLNDPFGNWVIWSALPPEAIAEVDVVRGAGAGPYGSGSLTGVVTLTERNGTGLAANAEAGELGQRRIAAAGGAELGDVTLFGSASAQQSDGWIPIAPQQRGPADDEVTLKATNASLRGEFQPADGTAVAVRVSGYSEERDSGLVGASSSAKGMLASLTIAHPEQDDRLGWRLQGWWRDTDFTNTSVTVNAGRASTTPSNDQYATPTIGWGANAALRGQLAWLNWELGADVRSADGESQEYYQYVSGQFTQERIAGGKTQISGVYLETAMRNEQWLVTVGIRADQWRSSDGHLIQRARATGVPSLEQYPESQSGVVPTARAGIRRAFAGGATYIHAAAYGGFRTPSLNELYRPFRLGNNITQANAALQPERLYGAEVGAGGAVGNWSWDLTLFGNQLKHAITNVTIGQGPGTFPGVGFVPAGGLLIQRQNAGDIDAMGVEAEVRWRLTDKYSLRAALALVDAEVDGGAQAPQLTGKRPAQAPHSTVTAGLVLTPFAHWTGNLNYRYESLRYADDLNTLPLGSANAVDVRITWAPSQRFGIYAAVNNLLDADIATTQTADKVVSYAAPRTFLIGVRVGS